MDAGRQQLVFSNPSRYPLGDSPADKSDNYIKRCTGVAGEIHCRQRWWCVCEWCENQNACEISNALHCCYQTAILWLGRSGDWSVNDSYAGRIRSPSCQYIWTPLPFDKAEELRKTTRYNRCLSYWKMTGAILFVVNLYNKRTTGSWIISAYLDT